MAPRSFEIFDLSVGKGRVGVSPIPGRSGSYEADLSVVLHWAPDLVLTMTTQAELDRMGASDFGADLRALGIVWHHLPIADFGAPDVAVQAAWDGVCDQGAQVLGRGGKILTHCFGGCGRSGMAALRLMIEAGEEPDTALARLRETRPCAVEAESQKTWAFSAAV